MSMNCWHCLKLPIWGRLLAWPNTIRRYWLLKFINATDYVVFETKRPQTGSSQNDSRISETNFPDLESKASACDIFPSTNNEQDFQSFRQANAQYFVL